MGALALEVKLRIHIISHMMRVVVTDGIIFNKCINDGKSSGMALAQVR